MNKITAIEAVAKYGIFANLLFFGLTFWGLGGDVKLLFIVSVIGRLQKTRDKKGNNIKKRMAPSFIVGRMRIALHTLAIKVIIADKRINFLHKVVGSDVSIDFMEGYELLEAIYSFVLHISSAGATMRYINTANIESCAIHLNLFSENWREVIWRAIPRSPFAGARLLRRTDA